jgi:hypothetical protein
VIINAGIVRKHIMLLDCSSNSNLIISSAILTLAKIVGDEELCNRVTEENVIAPLLSLITRSNSVVN